MAPKAPKPPPRTEDYRHADAARANNPEAGLFTYDKKVQQKVRYAYDPHMDPQLVWASNAERADFTVDTVSLHVQERISTQAIVRSVQREAVQGSLFDSQSLPIHKAVQFYEHQVGWSNRLILGDSLLVMNSLLTREKLGGKVQMVYMDPPYGVAYNSNFQPRVWTGPRRGRRHALADSPRHDGSRAIRRSSHVTTNGAPFGRSGA